VDFCFVLARESKTRKPILTALGLRWSSGFSRFWRIQGAQRLKAVLQRKVVLPNMLHGSTRVLPVELLFRFVL
jgi:hypothetical protein